MTSFAMRSKIAIRTRLGLLSIDVLDLVMHGDLAMQYRKYNGGSGVIVLMHFWRLWPPGRLQRRDRFHRRRVCRWISIHLTVWS